MSTFLSVLWEEYVIFKRKFWTTTLASMVSPILYLIAFGWGIGGGLRVEGKSYINFIIPGIIGLTTMIVSYNNTANSLSISRIFYKTFESFMMAPINLVAYVLGKISAGALTGMYSALLIIVLSLVFKTGITITPYFIFMIILNSLVFAAVGFIVGIFINSHRTLSKFSNFVITPMSFLCGTFFPLDKMPKIIKNVIWLLPLTHTSLGLRSRGENLLDVIIHPMVLIGYFIILVFVGFKGCKKAE